MAMVLKIFFVVGVIGVLQISSLLGKPFEDHTIQAVYIRRDGNKICAGTALSRMTIVTTASCFFDGTSNESVKSINLKRIDVVASGFHETNETYTRVNEEPFKPVAGCIRNDFKVKAPNHANDIIILRLRNPIDSPFPYFIRPSAMVEADAKLTNHTDIHIVGYAQQHNDTRPRLYAATLKLTPEKNCTETFKDVGSPTPDQFCAHGDFGVCNGDGGLSAYADSKVVGFVANWKPNCETNVGLPVIFTSIAYHRDFIDECLSVLHTLSASQTNVVYVLDSSTMTPREMETTTEKSKPTVKKEKEGLAKKIWRIFWSYTTCILPPCSI